MKADEILHRNVVKWKLVSKSITRRTTHVQLLKLPASERKYLLFPHERSGSTSSPKFGDGTMKAAVRSRRLSSISGFTAKQTEEQSLWKWLYLFMAQHLLTGMVAKAETIYSIKRKNVIKKNYGLNLYWYGFSKESTHANCSTTEVYYNYII